MIKKSRVTYHRITPQHCFLSLMHSHSFSAPTASPCGLSLEITPLGWAKGSFSLLPEHCMPFSNPLLHNSEMTWDAPFACRLFMSRTPWCSSLPACQLPLNGFSVITCFVALLLIFWTMRRIILFPIFAHSWQTHPTATTTPPPLSLLVEPWFCLKFRSPQSYVLRKWLLLWGWSGGHEWWLVCTILAAPFPWPGAQF